MPNSETTTKFKVDISELKAEFQQARREIRLANSEFKAATSGMDDWGDSADGLSIKITQLDSVMNAQKKQLSALERQYALVAEEQGENSQGAQELLIKINNQKAAIGKTEKELNKYKERLSDAGSASEDMADGTEEAVSASEKLKKEINKQEEKLEQLKTAYSNVALEQGQSSVEAKELGDAITKLSAELQENKTKLSQAEEAADSFDNALVDVEESAEEAGDGFTVMKGAISSLVADAIRLAIDQMKELATESERAYNSFQVQTGASAEETRKFKKEIDDLYLDGYGEDLNNVADSIAKVKQYTGEVDPTKLKELTENAIAFSDSFDTDFNESLRGADALMKNMGLTSEEAFDLMAKGVQRGLDKSGELGDNIAEYSQLWSQAGFSAEDMFSILENGLNSGAYNLDKVNDFVKEFTISLSDGRIEENIESFSSETQSLFNGWKEGKVTSKEVFASVINDLNNTENEQKALTVASTVWSALGEDNAMKVIKSLNNTNDAYNDVGGTMKEIKKIKYDDVANEWKKLGRTAKQELLQPLLKQILPGVKSFVKLCINNFDAIIPIVHAVGTAVATAFAIKKVVDFTASLKGLFGVMMANPIGILVGAMVTLGTGMVAYEKSQQKVIEKQYGLTDAQKETIEKTKELHDAYTTMDQERKESIEGINTEYGYLTQLKDELNGLTDSNGQVQAGYEDRANFIVNELSNALGIEKTKIWEIINTNGDLGESIDKIIEKKQAEATLAADEDAYAKAKKNSKDALKVYQDNLETLEEAEKKYNETKDKGTEALKNYQDMLANGSKGADAYYQENKTLIEANEVAKESYDKAKKAVEDSEETYIGYITTIQNHEGLSSAIISGDSGKIAEALNNLENNFITAENGTKSSLENQVKNMKSNLKELEKAIAEGTPGVTQQMVDDAKSMVEKATTELNKFGEKGKKAGEKGGEGAAEGLRNKIPTGQENALAYAQKLQEAMQSPDFTLAGFNVGMEFDSGIGTTKDVVGTTAKGISDNANLNLGGANTESTGANKGLQFNKGLSGNNMLINATATGISQSANKGLDSANTSGTGRKKGTEFDRALGNVGVYSTAKGKSDEANRGLGSADTYTTGNNFTQGFNNGMGKGNAAGSIWDVAWNLGKMALNALKGAIQEGSPSKLTARSGRFFGEGFARGIAKETKNVVKSVKTMANDAMKELNKETQGYSFRANVIEGKSRIAQRDPAGSAITGNMEKSAVINHNYYYEQYNTSPKSLSRIEIYRQTRNQLNFKIQGV